MKRPLAICALLSIAVLAGCGGGSSSGGSSAGTGRATVILTDSFREDYAHVWATVYKVELVSDSGSTVTVFSDASGKQIDLKTLRDSTGARFSFLGSATIPTGTYTGVKVTVGPTMQLIPTGVTTGSTLTVDDSLPKDASGNPIISFTFKTAKTITATATNIVVDFDLAHFIVRASKVLPALQEGDGTGLTDHSRHNEDEYRGLVSGLSGTSPTLTFTLTTGTQQTVTVTTTAATSVFGTGTVVNGSVVEVQGTLDPTTQTLVATQIEAHAANTSVPQPHLGGAASNLNATAGTFTLTPNLAHGCLPTQTTVNVVTTATTSYLSDTGTTLTQADFFTAAATTPNVTVTGTYDATSNTLTATEVKITDTTQDGDWNPGNDHFRKGSNAQNWGHGIFRQ